MTSTPQNDPNTGPSIGLNSDPTREPGSAPQPDAPAASGQLPTLAAAKDQAKRLRARLASDGTEIGHGQALELVAQQHGFRDWNTFHAAIGNRAPEAFTPGGRVQGRYLGQPFIGTVRAAALVRTGWFRLELDLDEPVDVVTFESFSNLRRRIRGIVGPAGTSRERSGNGDPVLEVEL